MAERKTKPAPVPISGLAHIGIRVYDLERSVRFYALLGFTKTAGPIGPEPVAILDHPSGVELNLVLNAPSANEPNVLMDIPMKHPGITHFALLCPDIVAAKERLEAAGIPLSGGPVRFGPARPTRTRVKGRSSWHRRSRAPVAADVRPHALNGPS